MARSESIMRKKKKNALESNHNNIFGPDGNIESSEEYKEILESMISEPRTISINEDFDDFMKRKRIEELKCLLKEEVEED